MTRKASATATHQVGKGARADDQEGPAATVRTRLRFLVGLRSGRVLVVVATVVAVLAAVTFVTGLPLEARTFAGVTGPVQGLISVFVAFLGVLLVKPVHRPAASEALVSSVLAALPVAAVAATFGVALAVVITAITNSSAPGGRWQHAGIIFLGSLLVQVVATLTGTGLGLLIRRPMVACLLTVAPLGLWLLLGSLPGLRPAQVWLTPFASVQHLLSGTMNPLRWAQWLVVVTIWGLGLNLAGSWRASRTRPTKPRQAPS